MAVLPPVLTRAAAAVSTLLLLQPASAQTSGVGSCSESSPCASGCCSSSGYCGFGPDFCGDTCISDCDAVAQCGQYAAVNGTTCPLNVCCSQYGFCGTTTLFCGAGCQSGCEAPAKPGCSSTGGSATKKVIGYYESWAKTRPCNAWSPSDIDATKWTHLNYAFALIHDSTYAVAQMNDYDTDLYPQFTALKQDNPALQVFISVGGWSAGGTIFSDMSSTAENRGAFISSLMAFLKTYAFDGVDIDWEYPVASDRGGAPEDMANYVSLLSELRSAMGTGYGLTATLPSSYWYLQNFDVAGMEQYVDWFNVMTYDLHGTWDGNSPYTQAVVQAHTNLTEIDDALDLLWRNSIDSSKVILGLGFYGRSFTLKDPSCTAPGCPFSAGGDPGECTATSGILSDNEIQGIISKYDVTPTLDETAAVKYMTWDTDQWVSYDDAETFQMKLDYANQLCLGGTMAWSLDQDTVGVDESVDFLLAGPGASMGVDMKTAVKTSNSYALGLFWTPCMPQGSQWCPDGYTAIAYGHGKVFDADLQYNTAEGCHGGGVNGFQRALCAAQNIVTHNVQWGPGSRSKACNSKCPTGWVTLSKNSHIGGQKSGCKSGKYAPLCAEKITVYGALSCYSNTLGQVITGGLEGQGLPPIGWELDSDQGTLDTRDERVSESKNGEGTSRGTENQMQKRAIKGAVPCGRSLPVGAIALEVPAYLSMYIVGGNIYYDVQATSIKSSPSASKKPTRTVRVQTSTTTYTTQTRTCEGDRYPQACFHYSSVAQTSTYSRATCSNNHVSDKSRPLVSQYNKAHTGKGWFLYIAKSYVNPSNERKGTKPQRDEFPPNCIQQGRADGYIRLIPGDQNSGCANTGKGGFKGICKFPPDRQIDVEGGPITDMGNYFLVTIYTSTIYTLGVMSYTWESVNPPAGDPYGLTANVCRPSVLTADVGFALLINDPWYGGGNGPAAYNLEPPYYLTQGVNPPTYKRAAGAGDAVLVVDEGNSTRLATPEELRALGYARCATPSCDAELALLRRERERERELADAAAARALSEIRPPEATSAATATAAAGAVAASAAPTRARLVAESSRPTATATGS